MMQCIFQFSAPQCTEMQGTYSNCHLDFLQGDYGY